MTTLWLNTTTGEVTVRDAGGESEVALDNSPLITGTNIAVPPQPDIYGQTVMAPTAQLRFMHGRLQQAWESRNLGRYGQTISVQIEWVDVPDATDLGKG